MRFGAVFTFSNHAVRCGAVRFSLFQKHTVRCSAVFGTKILRFGTSFQMSGISYVYRDHVRSTIPTWNFISLRTSFSPTLQFCVRIVVRINRDILTRSAWFDDTVRGVFRLRMSSIRTVRNACSTDCHHTIRPVRCGLLFVFPRILP